MKIPKLKLRGALKRRRSVTGNPIKYDPVLMDLMTMLDVIKTYEGFTQWKDDFILRFEEYLGEMGSIKAAESYQAFRPLMDRLVRSVAKISHHVNNGNLSPTRVTVKGRKSLTEAMVSCNQVADHLRDMAPSTAAAEKLCGYNKYHMGSVLIQDGFTEYERLVMCRDVLALLRERVVDQIVDRQIMNELDRYGNAIDQFTEILKDLSLHTIILRARKLRALEIPADLKTEMAALDDATITKRYCKSPKASRRTRKKSDDKIKVHPRKSVSAKSLGVNSSLIKKSRSLESTPRNDLSDSHRSKSKAQSPNKDSNNKPEGFLSKFLGKSLHGVEGEKSSVTHATTVSADEIDLRNKATKLGFRKNNSKVEPVILAQRRNLPRGGSASVSDASSVKSSMKFEPKQPVQLKKDSWTKMLHKGGNDSGGDSDDDKSTVSIGTKNKAKQKARQARKAKANGKGAMKKRKELSSPTGSVGRRGKANAAPQHKLFDSVSQTPLNDTEDTAKPSSAQQLSWPPPRALQRAGSVTLKEGPERGERKRHAPFKSKSTGLPLRPHRIRPTASGLDHYKQMTAGIAPKKRPSMVNPVSTGESGRGAPRRSSSGAARPPPRDELRRSNSLQPHLQKSLSKSDGASASSGPKPVDLKKKMKPGQKKKKKARQYGSLLGGGGEGDEEEDEDLLAFTSLDDSDAFASNGMGLVGRPYQSLGELPLSVESISPHESILVSEDEDSSIESQEDVSHQSESGAPLEQRTTNSPEEINSTPGTLQESQPDEDDREELKTHAWDLGSSEDEELSNDNGEDSDSADQIDDGNDDDKRETESSPNHETASKDSSMDTSDSLTQPETDSKDGSKESVEAPVVSPRRRRKHEWDTTIPQLLASTDNSEVSSNSKDNGMKSPEQPCHSFDSGEGPILPHDVASTPPESPLARSPALNKFLGQTSIASAPGSPSERESALRLALGLHDSENSPEATPKESPSERRPTADVDMGSIPLPPAFASPGIGVPKKEATSASAPNHTGSPKSNGVTSIRAQEKLLSPIARQKLLSPRTRSPRTKLPPAFSAVSPKPESSSTSVTRTPTSVRRSHSKQFLKSQPTSAKSSGPVPQVPSLFQHSGSKPKQSKSRAQKQPTSSRSLSSPTKKPKSKKKKMRSKSTHGDDGSVDKIMKSPKKSTKLKKKNLEGNEKRLQKKATKFNSEGSYAPHEMMTTWANPLNQ